MPRRFERKPGGKQSRPEPTEWPARYVSPGRHRTRPASHRSFPRATGRPIRACHRLLVILRPRSATLIDDRMFSSAFSTRRNAAIAWTSGSLGSALMFTGMATFCSVVLKRRRSIERHGRLQILDRVVVEERAGVRRLHDGRAVELLELEMSEGWRKVVRIAERAEHRQNLPEPAVTRQTQRQRQRRLVHVGAGTDVEPAWTAIDIRESRRLIG